MQNFLLQDWQNQLSYVMKDLSAYQVQTTLVQLMEPQDLYAQLDTIVLQGHTRAQNVLQELSAIG